MLEFWQVVVVVLGTLLVELPGAWQTERPPVAEQVKPRQQPEK